MRRRMTSTNHHVVLEARLGRICDADFQAAALHPSVDIRLNAKSELYCAAIIVLILQILKDGPLVRIVGITGECLEMGLHLF